MMYESIVSIYYSLLIIILVLTVFGIKLADFIKLARSSLVTINFSRISPHQMSTSIFFLVLD